VGQKGRCSICEKNQEHRGKSQKFRVSYQRGPRKRKSGLTAKREKICTCGKERMEKVGPAGPLQALGELLQFSRKKDLSESLDKDGKRKDSRENLRLYWNH